jgi:hypothetical protein
MISTAEPRGFFCRQHRTNRLWGIKAPVTEAEFADLAKTKFADEVERNNIITAWSSAPRDKYKKLTP